MFAWQTQSIKFNVSSQTNSCKLAFIKAKGFQLWENILKLWATEVYTRIRGESKLVANNVTSVGNNELMITLPYIKSPNRHSVNRNTAST